MDRIDPQLSYFALPVLRRLVLPAALALAVLAMGLTAVFLRDRAGDRQLARQAADDLVQLQKASIERELASSASILLHFAEQSVLGDFVAGRIPRRGLEAEYARFCRVSVNLDQVRLIGPGGQEQIRVNCRGGAPEVVGQEALQSKAGRSYFERTWSLPRSAVYVSPFDLNVEHGRIEEPWKPMLRLATPVFGEGGAKRGILVFNFLGQNLLDELARGAARVAGWSALVDGEGHFLQGPTPESSWGFMYGRPPAFARAYPEAWARVAGQPFGSFVDGRGLFTHGRIDPELRGVALDRRDFALAVVAFTPSQLLYAASWGSFGRLAAVAALAAAVTLLVAWGLAHARAVRARQEEQIAASERRLRALSQGLLELQEAERKSLSRDLHDELGQLATALSIDLGRASRSDPGGLKDALIERGLDTTAQLLEAIRRLSSRIRSSMLDDLGLEAALESLCEEFQERTGVATRLELDLDHVPVPETVAVNVYRLVQEALTNVARHAGARDAKVGGCIRDGRFGLTVEDAGRGFEPGLSHPGRGRLGLLGMRERVELLGGSFEVRSRPGEGTRIDVAIPLDAGSTAGGAGAG